MKVKVLAVVGVLMMVGVGAAWGQAKPDEKLPFDHWAYDALQTVWDAKEGLPASPLGDSIKAVPALTRGEFGKAVHQVLFDLVSWGGENPRPPRARLRAADLGPKVAPVLGRLVDEFWVEMDTSSGSSGSARLLLGRFPEGHWFYAQTQELLHAPVARMDEVVPFDCWAYDAMQKLVDLGVVVGVYPAGTFRGNRALTRGEFAGWVWRLLRDLDRARDAAEDPWPTRERLRTDRPLADKVRAILAKLIGEFRPELELIAAADESGPLSRWLAAVPEGHWFYERAQGLLATSRTAPETIAPPPPAQTTTPPPAAPPAQTPAPARAPRVFPDVPPDHWAAAAVTHLREAGIMEGYPGGEFGGE